MNNDLISREALKEAIELEEGIFWDSYSPNELVVRKKYIDNAPTVTIDNYSMGYQDGVRKVLSERPTGKWIKDENGIDRCSECGNRCITFVMGKPSDKFCIECGADMRKEADNETN